ncbi:hypothetical protein [Marinibacterium profundimaris]|uniref:Uncharacterized protein n=1 Tax=Marinibacterium profundimaris TaxID=1679460 RepID=A0A225NC60_9RHOB|nr:hypothetical protein [Marinibacterium profundimaris]OWU67882.1 hypothetical protein ATO3_25385 [Marinibacterium profundimaris]
MNADGSLELRQDGDYTVEYYNNFVLVRPEGGRPTIFDLTTWSERSIQVEDLGRVSFEGGEPDNIGISGVGFIGADESGTQQAETETDIDEFLAEQLATTDAGSLAQTLTIDGSKANTFAVIWEYLDDGYVADGYYAPVNENFVRLGIAYADYLEDGGAPLTDLIGKFTPDGPDGDLVPERLQSLHDNLLGNLGRDAIEDRFDGALEAELIAAVEAVDPDLLDRTYYSGADNKGEDYDAVRAYDYDKGYARTDFIDRFFGDLDDRATDDQDGDEMIFGDGNSATNYAVSRHEGAGVELALKAKIRFGGDVDEDDVTYNADGTATFDLEATPASTDRMEWNIDWAATITEAGDDDDFTFRFLADVDGSAAEDFVDLTETGSEYSDDLFSDGDLQNSWNYGFFTDDVFDTTNAAGLYTVRLEAYDADELIAAQEIYLDVA